MDDDVNANEFLTLKSTEQQKQEGVERPVDTAFVEESHGQLLLKAVFDVHHFKPEHVSIKAENGQLKLTAQCLDDADAAVYRKTMVRTIDLPPYADVSALQYDIDADGILTAQMPLNLPQKAPPQQPGVVPIVVNNGRRSIRLQFHIGSDFTIDDVKVNVDDKLLEVAAFYEAELGVEGAQVTRRELRKKFIVPQHIDIDDVAYSLRPDGVLRVEIFIKDDESSFYRCSVTTEDVTGRVRQPADTD